MAHFVVLDTQVEVDLRRLTVVDSSGRALLSKIHIVGSCLAAEEVAMILSSRNHPEASSL
jgi:ABC-type transporter Mla MlaB component